MSVFSELTADFGLRAGETFEPAAEVADPINPSGPYVMTVLGPIEPSDLGVCLPHEHLLSDPGALTASEPDYRLDDRHAALAELETWSLVGGGAVVDATTVDYGRDPLGLHWLATRSPVHIVMVTGRHNSPHAERAGDTVRVDSLRDEMVAEATDGVGAKRVRPGLIMLGTSSNASDKVEERVARAAAQAHLLTGLPIMAEAGAGTVALEQLDLLASEGVPLDRVILGHRDRRLDGAYLVELLSRGAWVSFDQIGQPHHGPDEPNADMLARLFDAGYGSKLLVSQDLARRSLFPSYGGEPGWLYLLQRFTLMLMEAGLSGEEVRALLVENPARALSIQWMG